MDYTYCFKLFPEIINQYSYKYKFFDTVEKKKKKKKKKIEIVKFILLICNLLANDLVLKERLSKVNL